MSATVGAAVEKKEGSRPAAASTPLSPHTSEEAACVIISCVEKLQAIRNLVDASPGRPSERTCTTPTATQLSRWHSGRCGAEQMVMGCQRGDGDRRKEAVQGTGVTWLPRPYIKESATAVLVEAACHTPRKRGHPPALPEPLKNAVNEIEKPIADVAEPAQRHTVRCRCSARQRRVCGAHLARRRRTRSRSLSPPLSGRWSLTDDAESASIIPPMSAIAILASWSRSKKKRPVCPPTRRTTLQHTTESPLCRFFALVSVVGSLLLCR